jgi:hypothetical protein
MGAHPKSWPETAIPTQNAALRSRSRLSGVKLMALVRPGVGGQHRPRCCSFAVAEADTTLCGGCGPSRLTPFAHTELPGSRATSVSIWGQVVSRRSGAGRPSAAIATVGARDTSQSVFEMRSRCLARAFAKLILTRTLRSGNHSLRACKRDHLRRLTHGGFRVMVQNFSSDRYRHRCDVLSPTANDGIPEAANLRGG